MGIALKLAAVLFAGGMLEGCATTAQNGYAPTNGSAKYDQMVKWDLDAVAHGSANPVILKYDGQMADLQPGSPEYDRFAKLKLAADQQWYRKLQSEGRLGSFSSTPVPLGGTYAPGNTTQSQSGPDLGAIGWKQQGGLHACSDGAGMVGTGPSGEPLCN